MEQATIELINMLSKSVLLKLKKQCEAYCTYTIDFKQINNKNNVKTRQKVFADILEQVNATLVFKQVEDEKTEEEKKEEKKPVVVSTMPEQQLPQVPCEDNKKNNNAKKTKKGGDR